MNYKFCIDFHYYKLSDLTKKLQYFLSFCLKSFDEIRQVKCVTLLLFSIKLTNPLQKHSHIIK